MKVTIKKMVDKSISSKNTSQQLLQAGCCCGGGSEVRPTGFKK